MAALLYCGALFLAACGAGSLLTPRRWRAEGSRLEISLYCLGLGYLAIGMVLWASSVVAPVTCWHAGGVLAAAAVGLPRFYRIVQGSPPRRSEIPTSWWGVRAPLVLLGLFAGLNLLGALAPPTMSDVLHIHLGAARHYATVGGFPFVPYFGWSAVGLQSVIYTHAVMLSSAAAPAVIHWALGLLTV
ncbi:MAG: hypothetical protein AB1514_16590, partial [Pseudomonadota bacterium]